MLARSLVLSHDTVGPRKRKDSQIHSGLTSNSIFQINKTGTTNYTLLFHKKRNITVRYRIKYEISIETFNFTQKMI
jgi:hypothetical protein